MITKLDQMLELVRSKSKKRLSVAFANDAHTLEAVNAAVERGIVEATLVGDTETIKKVCAEHHIDVNKFQIIQENNEQKAADKAVELINEGKADILMKGLVSTDKYMRAILNKEKGLMPGPKATLTHITVAENPAFHKLLVVGDVAIIPNPDLNQKIYITNALIKTAKALGIEMPKVALIAATEQMSAGMQACIDAAIISKMADRNQISGAYVDGPLALDTAIDKESAMVKKLKGEVAGDADCLLFPNIEAGNMFYKANSKLCGGEQAAMVAGAKVPCVLSSRSDSEKTKLYSIALAALNA